MTREEEIKQAAENNLDVSIYTPKDGELLKEVFYIGAKWADKTPKCPWISVKDDLPCNHEELLDPSCEYNETVIVLTACGDGYSLNWMELRKYGEWEWHGVKNVTHWMILPELPKE